MNCYLLTVFVFVFSSTLAKGYNIPIPLALLEPRTKYDYDLTRFFLGTKKSDTAEVKDYKDFTQVYHIETPIHQDEQYYQTHPIHFGSPYSPLDHRSKVSNHDQFGSYKPFYIKFQHDPPKRPYHPSYEITNAQNEADIKTGPLTSFIQNSYFPTTTAHPLPPVTIVPPAPPALWTRPTPAPQGSFFGVDTTKPAFNPNVFHRFGETVQEDTTKGFGTSYGAFANANVDIKKDFASSVQSFNQQNNYRTTSVPVPVPAAINQSEITTTTTTTTKPGKTSAALSTSLAEGGDFEVKYKETETDYYDFDEEDLKRPQYDISASRKLFEEFIKKYEKTYKDKQDEEIHYQHFVNSLMTVNRLNSEGGSASFDINFLSDEEPKVYGK